MTTRCFQYEGKVVLGCQEGGFVAPVIELVGLPGETVGPFKTVVPKTLDEVLSEGFDPVEIDDSPGNKSVGKLRITVERIE